MPQTKYGQRYNKGILLAAKKEFISYHGDDIADVFGPPIDCFDFLPRGTKLYRGKSVTKLSDGNTRRLMPAAEELIKMRGPGSPLTYLEFGAGAGVACSKVFDLAKDTQQGPPNIITVSATPINPYMRLLYDSKKTLEMLKDFLRSRGQFGRVGTGLTSENIPLEFLLQIEEIGKMAGGPQFFQPEDAPFITSQYIGDYPKDFKYVWIANIQEKVKDAYAPLFYEEIGPNFHNSRAREGVSIAIDLLPDSRAYVLRRRIPKNQELWPAFRKHIEIWSGVVLFDLESRCIVMAKKDHPLSLSHGREINNLPRDRDNKASSCKKLKRVS